VVRTAFFGRIPEAQTLGGDQEEKVEVYTGAEGVLEHRHGLYLFMIIPLVVTAAFSILLCLFPNTFGIYDLTQAAVKSIFGGI
jgi:hypothetical protein